MLERIVHKIPKSSWKKDLGYTFLSLYLASPSPLTGYFWMVDGWTPFLIGKRHIFFYYREIAYKYFSFFISDLPSSFLSLRKADGGHLFLFLSCWPPSRSSSNDRKVRKRGAPVCLPCKDQILYDCMPEGLFISLFTMQEIPSIKRKIIVGFPAVKRQRDLHYLHSWVQTNVGKIQKL